MPVILSHTVDEGDYCRCSTGAEWLGYLNQMEALEPVNVPDVTIPHRLHNTKGSRKTSVPLPPNWKVIRNIVKLRDKVCQSWPPIPYSGREW